jgi:elongation factor 1-gamma
VPFDENVEKKNLEKLERSLTYLEGHLRGRNWVATKEKLSLVDITVTSALHCAFSFVIGRERRFSR